MRFENPIYVTNATVQPLDKYILELKDIWTSGRFTNNGSKVQLFEKKIDEFLESNQTVAVTNGTIAIQLALRALDIQGGEVITTPFTWIATSSSILWERCKPVFVDIEKDTFNIDPNKITSAITNKTRAILGVHVFSNPCNIEAIRHIANEHHLSVIYDGAHAFGVKYKNRSVLDYGDISTTSFHATKLLNSGEGGAVFAKGTLKEHLQSLRFFGYDSQKRITKIGCNGKMTEIHASLGLINLQLVPEIIQRRKEIFHRYANKLSNKVQYQVFDEDAYNYSYMPVVFESEEQTLAVIKKLQEANVFPRRYFYPSLNLVETVGKYVSCPISEDISKRILALPSYHLLHNQEIDIISELIMEVL